MRKRTALFVAITTMLGGCEARSISNSGYPGDYPNTYGAQAAAYRGELDDFDLLVPATSETIDDQQITKILSDHHNVHAQRGRPLLVVQSGAIAPDGEMIAALQRQFPVIPFNGQPPRHDDLPTRQRSVGMTGAMTPDADQSKDSYAHRLRLAAAEGGASRIFVYWGVLETAQRNQPTELISWVPIIGRAIPDRSQQMRIRLKGAIIDTATGQWQVLLPEPITDDALSSSLTRRASDQDQVALLKQQGYLALANQLALTAD